MKLAFIGLFAFGFLLMVNAQEPQANGQKPIAADTLTAVNGYKVSSMTVKDADNQDVSLTDNQNGTWTFTMPAKTVTVTPVATRFYQVSSNGNISYDVVDANDKMNQQQSTSRSLCLTVTLFKA